MNIFVRIPTTDCYFAHFECSSLSHSHPHLLFHPPCTPPPSPLPRPQVYAVASEDMDALTFGSPRFLRHLLDPAARKLPVMEFDLSKVGDGMAGWLAGWPPGGVDCWVCILPCVSPHLQVFPPTACSFACCRNVVHNFLPTAGPYLSLCLCVSLSPSPSSSHYIVSFVSSLSLGNICLLLLQPLLSHPFPPSLPPSLSI